MIVKEAIDFVSISTGAEKIARCGHTAFWLEDFGVETGSALKAQERDITKAFLSIADLLGYSVEKIEPAALQAAE